MEWSEGGSLFVGYDAPKGLTFITYKSVPALNKKKKYASNRGNTFQVIIDNRRSRIQVAYLKIEPHLVNSGVIGIAKAGTLTELMSDGVYDFGDAPRGPLDMKYGWTAQDPEDDSSPPSPQKPAQPPAAPCEAGREDRRSA